MKNNLKAMLREDRRALGTFYELGGIAAARCIGIAGMDFAVIDTEHGFGDVESTIQALAALSPYSTTPLVRVKDGTRASVLKMLDIGAMGIIVPNVETPQEVRQLVAYAKYYPVGKRGFAPSMAGDYGYAGFSREIDTYFSVSNAETLLLPQCETLGCLRHIEEIAGTEGVDGIFVGPYDLSIEMGKPAQMEDPELLGAIAHVLEVCRKHGKICMIYAGTPEKAGTYFDMGFSCVVCGMDNLLLIESLQAMRAQLQGRLNAR